MRAGFRSLEDIIARTTYDLDIRRTMMYIPVLYEYTSRYEVSSDIGTYQSRMSTLLMGVSCCTTLTATATLLKKQKPICSSGSE